jgi:hypothetical protein
MGLLGKVSGLNWYKWGAIALVAIALAGSGYLKGKHAAEMKCEQDKTEQARQEATDTIGEVNERLPVVQRQDAVSAEQRAEIKRLEGELHEALRNRQTNPVCDLSDAEFDATNGLLRATQFKK